MALPCFTVHLNGFCEKTIRSGVTPAFQQASHSIKNMETKTQRVSISVPGECKNNSGFESEGKRIMEPLQGIKAQPVNFTG
jgi:tryptophan 2,3-dioxygenase